MESIQQSMEDTLDDLLEQKLKTVSNAMANSVTKKIMISMEKFFNAKQKQQLEGTNEPGVIEQDDKTTNNNGIQTQQISDNNEIEQTENTDKKMMDALVQIENQTTPPDDSTHDKLSESYQHLK